MTDADVSLLARALRYRRQSFTGSIEQTHISWVVLIPGFAIKIKKPVKLTFLDFSSLALRKYYCEREVELNRRLTTIYLSVQPIRKRNGSWIIGGNRGDIIDYCVVMKRMSLAKRMDNQMKKGTVTERQVRALAKKIAHFHATANKVFTPFDLAFAKETFNEIRTVDQFTASVVSTRCSQIITRAIGVSDDFLESHSTRLQQRIDRGLKRDIHGDLHAGNIFLYRDPVIFDCIEFNDAYRTIDVLYEVAFLCMELEASRLTNLSVAFLVEYKTHFPALQTSEDELLFLYFKALRANIRAKVHVLSAQQATKKVDAGVHIRKVRTYLLLMNQYIARLQATAPDDKSHKGHRL